MASFTHYSVTNQEQIPILKGTSEVPVGNDFLQHLSIKIMHLDEDTIVFDLIGVDVSIANALRRILLAEVPTVAIETVYIQDNTSILQDEVLSHRLGLVPIKADPRLFDDYSAEDDPTDLNTVVFKLDVTCESGDGDFTRSAYSGDLEWQPQGDQAEKFPEGIRPVHGDIPLVVMKPGQSVRLEAHCHKGVGKDHTKYSPCATASYRLMPDITVGEEVRGQLATELVDMCPMQVFDIEDIGKGGPRARVARPRDCTMCRECIRRDGWDKRVSLKRVAQHFIFTVESTGCLPPQDLVKMAIGVLRNKTLVMQDLVNQHQGINGEAAD